MVNWLFSLLAGTLSGTVAAMGLGGGFVLFLYLTLFTGLDFLQCQIVNLLFFLPCALLAAWRYRKDGLIQFPILLPMMLFGSAGVALGRLAAMWMGTQWVKWCFGAVLIPLGIKELFHKKQALPPKEKKESPGKFL